MQNARLPLPKNDQENENLKRALLDLGIPKSADGNTKSIIGTNDEAVEGEWRDSDGNILSYSDWGPNEGPHNHVRPYENFAAIYINGETGEVHWSDYSKRTSLNVVCVKGQ